MSSTEALRDKSDACLRISDARLVRMRDGVFFGLRSEVAGAGAARVISRAGLRDLGETNAAARSNTTREDAYADGGRDARHRKLRKYVFLNCKNILLRITP